MNVSFESGLQRFRACSKGLQIIILICVIVLSFLRVVRVWIEKPMDCEEQLILEYVQQSNTNLKIKQAQQSVYRVQQNQQQQQPNRQPQPQKQGQQIQEKKPPKIQQKSLGFRIFHRIQMPIKQFSLVGILILNIVGLASYQYLLISCVIYLILTVLRLQTLIKPKNIIVYMLLQRIPNLLVLSWFINFLAIPNTDPFNV